MDKNYYCANDIISDTIYQFEKILSKANSKGMEYNEANDIIVKATVDLKIILSRADNTGMENNEAYHYIKNLINALEDANNFLLSVN